MNKRIVIASWAFLIGSALFTVDAGIEVATQQSLISFVRLAEGLLFLTGSIFLLPIDES